MSDIKSKLQEFCDEIRKHATEQRADAEMAQGAFNEILLESYETIFQVMAEQIDSNASDIDEIRKQLRALGQAGERPQRYTAGRTYRELTSEEKESIEILMAANQVTPVGLPAVAANRDDFDRQDQLLAAGQLDQQQQAAY